MNGLISELKEYKRVFVVCDRNVERFAKQLVGVPDQAGNDSVRTSGPKGRVRGILAIEACEAKKTIDSVMDMCRWLLAEGADRDALVLAVGGGITTDMAGFAASIYKRGVRYANVPTTLLSMVDAGIGGKTGVNLDNYKNLLGVIRQPEFTAIFPEALQTLPDKELRSGLAEMLKTFIIKNPARAYERTVDLFSRGLPAEASKKTDKVGSSTHLAIGQEEQQARQEELSELIQIAAGIKQEIVDKDEFETGVRRKLNLGHTWGHAIEWWQREIAVSQPMTHGEAVAAGMVQAARYAEKLGITEEAGLSKRIASDLRSCGLPTELPCPAAELLPAMLKDKKAEAGQIRLVLPVRIGKVVVKKLKFEI